MALTSMTGFGQAVREGQVARVKVEIRTVNHRFAEFNLRMPRDLFALEEEVRAKLGRHIARGRTDAFVTMESTRPTDKAVSVDWNLLDSFCTMEREAFSRYPELAGNEMPSVMRWLNHPDVIHVQSHAFDVGVVMEDVIAAVEQACEDLLAMRRREGERIAADMVMKTQEFSRVVDVMVRQAPMVEEANRTRLLQRFTEFGQKLDEQRLLSEVALLVDRMSIDEELVRLKSHILEFERSLQEGSPIGRRLDFIVQEMHREVNTIGSKSGDLLISKAVVDGKTIVEQLREQAQNIE